MRLVVVFSTNAIVIIHLGKNKLKHYEPFGQYIREPGNSKSYFSCLLTFSNNILNIYLQYKLILTLSLTDC